MKSLAIIGLFLVAIASCKNKQVSTHSTNELQQAVIECEAHLAKLSELNIKLQSDLIKKEQAGIDTYFSDLELWFRDALISRAKLNARGGIPKESDEIDIKTIESLTSFYLESENILGQNSKDFKKVVALYKKYGYNLSVKRNLKKANKSQ